MSDDDEDGFTVYGADDDDDDDDDDGFTVYGADDDDDDDGFTVYGADDDDDDDDAGIPVFTPSSDDDDDDDDFDIPVFGDEDDTEHLDPITVGIAEYAVTDGSQPLSTSGLGSCVAVVVHDERAAVSGLLHFMLPESAKSKGRHDAEAKFADTGIETMLADLEAAGGTPSRSWAKLAGGASMIEFSGSDRSIGERNADAAREVLADHGVSIDGTDFGGQSGRSVVFDPETGEFTVKSASGEEKYL